MTLRTRRAWRLLLAEDDADLREVLAAVLQADGSHVVTATNGREALDLLVRPQAEAFDAAVLDVQMPLMTGLDVLRESRRLAVNVPIILITSFADEMVRGLAHALGAVRVVDKPLSAEDLRTAIRSAIR